MPRAHSRMTELDAVNHMLMTIGESPITVLGSSSGVPDAEAAERILFDTQRVVLEQGWHWNTEKQILLTPNTLGEINLPENCLRVDTVYESGHIDVTQRGDRLYNIKEHSYIFEDDLVVDMVVFLQWDEMPEAARRYIRATGTRSFQEKRMASNVVEQYVMQEEHHAKAALMDAELEHDDANLLRDSIDLAPTLWRY